MIEVERVQPGISVVALHGEHDLSTVGDVEGRIDTALDDSSGLVVDLSDTSFIDSAVLRLLITTQARAVERGVGFAVAVPDSSAHGVHRLLDLTGLADRLRTAPSRQGAIDAAVPTG
jgi:anti-anti-sigma factor